MYECSYCGLSLTRWGNYLEHVGAVHEGGKGMTKFKCRKCQKIFLKQNNFQAHCKNQNPRPCVKCDVVCCTRKQLEIHRRRVHPSFQCLKCEKYFQRKASLEKHESIRQWRKTSCSQCNESFCTMNTLRLHVVSVHQEAGIKELDDDVNSDEVPSNQNVVQKDCKTCPQCNKMFFDHYNVRRHMKTEHQRLDRCQCDECEKSFSTQYSLNYHVKTCHKKDNIFTCPVCEETFNTIAELFNHKKSAHNTEVKFECRYCGKHFKTKSNLNRHKQEIHCKGTRLDTSKVKVNLYSFACDQCSFLSKRNSLLLRHVRIKHDNSDPSKNLSTEDKKTCTYCSKIFCNSAKVKRHIMTIHKNEGSHDVIEENVKTSASLRVEPKDVIKKQCHYCEKTFLGSNLWRHIEEAHNKTKYNTALIDVSAYPHECEQCSFKSKRKFDLKRHYMHKHSLCDVTFACERCGKVFNYEASMKRHTKSCQEPIPKV